MISQAKKEANQRNAKASTGPRTSSGKATSSRNSRRHGLATAILEDPTWSYEVYKLAKVLAPEGEANPVGDEIRTLLTAMMEVMRVQAARNELWTVALMRQSSLRPDNNIAPKDEPGCKLQAHDVASDELEAVAALEILPQIVSLERYQRRAESHFRRVLKECIGVTR